MTATYTIAMARPRDLLLLPAIEHAAAKLLAGHAPEAVLAETTSKEALHEAQRQDHLWVALSAARSLEALAMMALVMRDATPDERSTLEALHVIGNPHAEGFYLACGFRILGTEHTRFGVGYRMQMPLQETIQE